MEDTLDKKYTFKDFASDQEVRWCPGCDDYVILRSMQKALPEMGVNKEDVVFISGIGCSAFSLLYRFLWDARYSRTSRGHIKWRKIGESGSERLDDYR